MMRLWYFILVSALTITTSNASCDADDCARAVTGTRTGKVPNISSREADCSSFQITTVTPAPSTVTAFTTVTSIPPHKRDAIAERQVTITPVSVPTYASACSGAVRYKSACSCWGITATVTTAPTPIVTVVSTVTVTPDECSNPGPSCGTYHPVTDPSCGPLGDCLCVTDTDGRAVCVQDISCSGAVSCTDDADCPGIEVCWAAGCCTGSGLCATPADICPFAPVKMLRMLRRGVKEVHMRDGCSNAGKCV